MRALASQHLPRHTGPACAITRPISHKTHADDDVDPGDLPGPSGRRAADAAGDEFYEDDLDDEDEMRDFIEHDGPGGTEQHRANARALAKSARAQGISTEAAQDLLDVFGHDAETKEMLANWYTAKEGAADAHDVDDEVRHRSTVVHLCFALCLAQHGASAAQRRSQPLQSAQPSRAACSRAACSPQEGGVAEEPHRQQADPTLLERFRMTAADQAARDEDKPERMLPFLGKLPAFDLSEAAQHIYEAIFSVDAPECVPKVRRLQAAGILDAALSVAAR